MNVDQLKKKYKHHCHIPIFEFKGVCVCACNLYEGLHENVHVFSSYHYMYHPPSYSKITIKQHYQRVLYLEQFGGATFNKQSTKLCCF